MLRRHVKTASIYFLGIFLIFVGILAGFVPLVPGIILIIIGIYVISFRSVWVKRKLDRFRAKHPATDRFIKIFEIISLKIYSFLIKIRVRIIRLLRQVI